jgi:hypothetical protein
MNINKVLTKDYENEPLFRRGKNKPNTNPIKPNFKRNPAPILRGDCPVVFEHCESGYSKSNIWSNLKIGAGLKWAITRR